MVQPGPLFVVVGPSGSGKDTLIAWLKDRLAGDPSIVFVRRTVTRTSNAAHEAHDTMSSAAFDRAEQDGQFAITWRAHGHAYGWPIAIAGHLTSGGAAIANGSRRSVDAIRARFERVQFINLTVSEAELRRRLEDRGRSTDSAVDDRLAESLAFRIAGADVVDVDNSGPIQDAGKSTLAVMAEAGLALPEKAERT